MVDEAGWNDYGLETEYVWNDYGTGVHSFEVKAEDNEGTFSNIISWNFVAIEEMILVEGGKFTMGDNWGDGYENELPLHEVTIDYDYFIGKYEVTFDEFDAFCDDMDITKPKDFSWGRQRRPVISVSWYEVTEYCNWLSDKAGLARAYDEFGNLLDQAGGITDDPSEVIGFRLPTEAEWEFAARGGDSESLFKYSGSNDPDEAAWYRENAHNDIVDSISTWPVGEKEPNGLGIHDMSGNGFEWCN
jgi:formylglycine-generating enzyme required for sulfatase activity